MELIEVLDKIGLDQKQSATYLAILELGSGSVYSIAKKAGLKRPTVYRILDELVQKGLVSIVPRIKKALYTAESPERLVGELHRKEEIVKRYLPQFLAIYNVKKDKPQVQLFEGREAVGQIYHRLYLSGEVWFFGTIGDVTKLYPEEFKIFLERIKSGQLVARDLFVNSQTDVEFAARGNAVNNYQIRFLPESQKFAITDFALCGNELIFFSFRPQIFAVAISSREVSGTFKTLYEFAWQAAEPLKQK
jgi:sugar-specific transcriptional regulator TrmB